MDANIAKSGSQVILTGEPFLSIPSKSKLTKDMEETYPITLTEQEVTDINKEIDITKYDRVTSRFILALCKTVDYLKVRFDKE